MTERTWKHTMWLQILDEDTMEMFEWDCPIDDAKQACINQTMENIAKQGHGARMEIQFKKEG